MRRLISLNGRESGRKTPVAGPGRTSCDIHCARDIRPRSAASLVRGYGVFGVSIFFVISGFIITLLLCLEERSVGRIHIGHFYWKRAFRILPPAVLYLVVANALLGVDLRDVAHCLLFVRNFFDGPIYTVHYWSLSIEEQFYLFWPVTFLMLRGPKQRIAILGVLVAIAPLWAHVLYHMAGGAQNVNPMRSDLRFSAIAFGCLLALLKDHYPATFAANPPRWSAIPIIGLLALAVSGIVPHAGMVAGIVEGITVAALINLAVNAPRAFWNGSQSRGLGRFPTAFIYGSSCFAKGPRWGGSVISHRTLCARLAPLR